MGGSELFIRTVQEHLSSGSARSCTRSTSPLASTSRRAASVMMPTANPGPRNPTRARACLTTARPSQGKSREAR